MYIYIYIYTHGERNTYTHCDRHILSCPFFPTFWFQQRCGCLPFRAEQVGKLMGETWGFSIP